MYLTFHVLIFLADLALYSGYLLHDLSDDAKWEYMFTFRHKKYKACGGLYIKEEPDCSREETAAKAKNYEYMPGFISSSSVIKRVTKANAYRLADECNKIVECSAFRSE